MKVIEVTCQHLLSGIGRYGLELSSGIEREGQLKAFYKPYKEGHPDSVHHESEWIRKVRYRSFRGMHPYLMPFFIRNALTVERGDLIHAHWFMSGLAASSYKKNPKIITMHDVSLLHLPEKGGNYIKYYAWAIQRFKSQKIPIIVVSEHAKQDAIKYAGYPEELVHVVYNGINHDQFFPQENETKRPKDRFRVVYSGGLGKRKNVGLLLKAYQQVEKKIKDTELVISGAHPERTEYPAMAEELGLKNVRFTGFIDDENMADFYRSGHLMVFPSEYEGFGLAPLESMACGTPVLCAKGGALQETSGQGAIYFDYDVGDLANKMILLSQNEENRSALTEQGLEHAQKYTWTKTAERTLELYRTLV